MYPLTLMEYTINIFMCSCSWAHEITSLNCHQAHYYHSTFNGKCNQTHYSLVENGHFSTSVCDYVLVASDKYD